MKKSILGGLACLMFLAACGNDPDAFSAAKSARALVSAKLPGKEEAQPAPAFTRAMLEAVLTPVQLVTIETRNQKALVAEIAQNGGVTTWSSVDKVTISLRNGGLVATRGLGDDLLAAAGPAPSARLAAGGPYSRSYTLNDGLDRAVVIAATCSVRLVGSQSIDIVEISYLVTELRERCEAKDQSFENTYWVDRLGHVRKSRQWVSPEVGTIVIEDLRK